MSRVRPQARRRSPLPSLNDLHPKRRYGGGRDNLLTDFYTPCLAAATRYDRAVGYFRATLLAIAGMAFGDFAARGGRARVVCSPSLNEEDARAVIKGTQQRGDIDSSLKRELESLVSDPRNRPFLAFLGALVALGVVEIKVARRTGASGIYHEKIGIFGDSVGNTLSFEGSSNETWSAWDPSGNVEGFSVFASWRSADQAAYTQNHRDYFKTLWNNEIPDLDVMPLPQAVQDELVSYAPVPDIDHYAEAVVRAFKTITPVLPVALPGILMKHQRDVLDSWDAQGQRGIVKHATGAGKTLTALEAIRRWGITGGPALVLVPTVVLQQQWRTEIAKHLPQDTAVLSVGGDTPKTVWRHLLSNWTAADRSMPTRVVLATMGTASTPAFMDRVNAGEHLLVVADEVHRLGSRFYQNALGIDAGGRLGLSATPERYHDPDGTHAIFDYFGAILAPEVTLEDAIKAGRLVPYEYLIDIVALDEDEQDEWDAFTSRIRTALGRADDEVDIRSDENLKRLLIRRSRIIKKARGKTTAASKLVAKHYEPGQAWILYCEDRDQMAAVTAAIRSLDLTCDTYDSSQSTASRSMTLEYFSRHGGILVAIRCLDEGVDIPAVDHALILASSRNPRQFIQRRGRVLRKAPGKFRATIHDIFVIPSRAGGAMGREALPIVRGEILRAHSFAKSATNRSVQSTILAQMRELGIDPTAPDTTAREADEPVLRGLMSSP